jgi:hypothetical protein
VTQTTPTEADAYHLLPRWFVARLISALRMEVALSSETTVHIRTARRYIAEDGSVRSQLSEDSQSLFLLTTATTMRGLISVTLRLYSDSHRTCSRVVTPCSRISVSYKSCKREHGPGKGQLGVRKDNLGST